MKYLSIVLAIASISFNIYAETIDAQNQTQAKSNTEIENSTPKSNNFSLSVNQIYYSLKGDEKANTSIYKFGTAKLDMTLLTGTYIYNTNWTFMVLAPYIKNEVETIYEPVQGGLNFSGRDTTEGLSDIRLMALTTILTNPKYFTLLDVGFTAPTGSINETFTTNSSQRASYNMQLGSGTPDLYVGTTTLNNFGSLSNTFRLQAAFRGGKNANGWSLGDEAQVKLTSNYIFNNNFSSGLAANYKIRGAVKGKDTKYEIMNNYIGTNGISGDGHQYYHFEQINWDANLVAKIQTSPNSKFSAALEFGAPIIQGFKNKDDVELKTNFIATGTLTGNF